MQAGAPSGRNGRPSDDVGLATTASGLLEADPSGLLPHRFRRSYVVKEHPRRPVSSPTAQLATSVMSETARLTATVWSELLFSLRDYRHPSDSADAGFADAVQTHSAVLRRGRWTPGSSPHVHRDYSLVARRVECDRESPRHHPRFPFRLHPERHLLLAASELAPRWRQLLLLYGALPFVPLLWALLYAFVSELCPGTSHC
jgi:hypothetical protein